MWIIWTYTVEFLRKDFLKSSTTLLILNKQAQGLNKENNPHSGNIRGMIMCESNSSQLWCNIHACVSPSVVICC